MAFTIPELLVSTWLVAALFMGAAWLVQRRTRNAAIVDAVWCCTFALVAFGYTYVTSGDPARRVLVASMAGLWGARLAGFVFTDRVLGRAEDPRYRSLREAWGERASLFFFLFFQLEALALPLFSLPLLVLMENASPTFGPWEWAGMLLWVIAITGEWFSDLQLAQFRADPQNRGKTCRRGLWRYSRHPNYFFESLHWWAYVVMAIGVPYWWVTLAGPIAMTITLTKVTGIPFTEAQALATRGEDYREYQRTTSALIPWFPKR